jgi:hypothetical protein
MKTTTEKAVEALDLLPEEMREPAVAYCLSRPRNFVRSRKRSTRAWKISKLAFSQNGTFDDFLREARTLKAK